MRRSLFGLLALVALLIPASASAQTQLYAYGGYGTFTGDDFEAVNAGYLVGASLHLGSMIQFGFGAELGQYTVGDSANDDDLEQIDLYGSLRFRGAPFYGGGRISYSTQSAIVTGGDELKRTGFGIGPEIGYQFPLGGVFLDISASYVLQSFGNSELEGVEIADSDATGGVLGIRAGITFGGR